MIEINKFTRKDVLIRLFNDIIQQHANNEMEVALWKEELAKPLERQEQEKKNLETSIANFESQMMKQEMAMTWLEAEIKKESKPAKKGTKNASK